MLYLDSPFLINDTYGLTVLTKDTKFPIQVVYVCLVDLQLICAKLGLKTWLSPRNDINICLLDMQRCYTKKTIWALNSKKCHK
jgi:hypothetical protein